jgi:hypothetical protein
MLIVPTHNKSDNDLAPAFDATQDVLLRRTICPQYYFKPYAPLSRNGTKD